MKVKMASDATGGRALWVHLTVQEFAKLQRFGAVWGNVGQTHVKIVVDGHGTKAEMRERQQMSELCRKGLSLEEIAREVGIDPVTVFCKLGLKEKQAGK